MIRRCDEQSFRLVLELGQTIRVAYAEKPWLPPEKQVAIPNARTAEWLYPQRRPMTAIEWSVPRPRLVAITPKNLFDTACEWTIES